MFEKPLNQSLMQQGTVVPFYSWDSPRVIEMTQLVEAKRRKNVNLLFLS